MSGEPTYENGRQDEAIARITASCQMTRDRIDARFTKVDARLEHILKQVNRWGVKHTQLETQAKVAGGIAALLVTGLVNGALLVMRLIWRG